MYYYFLFGIILKKLGEKMVAEVIINSTVKKLNKTFDYNIPTEIVGIIKLGDRVLLPFGNSKSLEEGFVIGLKEKSEYKIKDIVSIQEGFSLRMEYIEQLITQKKIKSDKQIRILRFLEENDGILTTDLEIFCEVSRGVINTLEKNGYIEIVEKQVERNPFLHKEIKRDTKLKLTEEQEHAFKEITNTMEECKFQEFLIYGITGSRKNRNLFTNYTKSIRKRTIFYYVSTRNIINTTNGRPFYCEIWTRTNSSIT